MTSDRIKEIQETTAYPESVSVMLALKQVWNECEQESNKYSEEEVEKLLVRFIIHIKSMDSTNRLWANIVTDWFEQNKKI